MVMNNHHGIDEPTLQEVALTRGEKILRSKYGLYGLGLISYAESVLPIPILTDPFLVVYILANRSKVILAVTVSVLASVIGGVTAYAMGYLFADLFLPFLGGEFLVQFNVLAAQLQEATFILTILGALTPIPYTGVAVAAGFVHGNLWGFIAGSLLARILRYGLVGILTYYFGSQCLTIIKQNKLLLVIATVILVLLYVAYEIWLA
jgi:membrane protein YqaA with SNARE-associated domain